MLALDRSQVTHKKTLLPSSFLHILPATVPKPPERLTEMEGSCEWIISALNKTQEIKVALQNSSFCQKDILKASGLARSLAKMAFVVFLNH